MPIWNDSDLNDEQKDAIEANGSVFLTACPGSGKTRTLTYKIADELSKLESKKQFVVAITYTHRAADEIYERIEELGIETSQLWIGTIHSFCLEWILKPYATYQNKLCQGFRVINSYDRERLLKKLCEPYRSPKITPWDCDFYFSKGSEPFFKCTPLNEQKKTLVQVVLKQYFGVLSRNRQIDYELMLYYAHELITKSQSISTILSNMFSIILVDEYQDTKEIQYSIIASILSAGKGKTKAFIVGDPNQAIFQSLGGFPIKATDFKTMTGIEMNELQLCKNYRSSERIVNYFSNFNVHETTIESSSKNKAFPSLITFNNTVSKSNLEEELARLIRFNIENLGIAPQEICVLAPQWVHLASITRKLVASMPEYSFFGPGMVPFSKDIDNFWYKVSRIALTTESPEIYIRRLRWASEVLKDLDDAGISLSNYTEKTFLRDCKSIQINEQDGLKYLDTFFNELFSLLGISFQTVPFLKENYDSFFKGSQERIDRLTRDGATFISDMSTFRKVFANRKGITMSTIHGIKGDEYDTVIAYALLEGLVPNSQNTNPQESARKLLYVISSRARKNLHLISERGRLIPWNLQEYQTTSQLTTCKFDYDTIPLTSFTQTSKF
jgi:DNA helicase II / ATP-dependent DNA helicase PcrA